MVQELLGKTTVMELDPEKKGDITHKKGEPSLKPTETQGRFFGKSRTIALDPALFKPGNRAQ